MLCEGFVSASVLCLYRLRKLKAVVSCSVLTDALCVVLFYKSCLLLKADVSRLMSVCLAQPPLCVPQGGPCSEVGYHIFTVADS